MDNAELESLYRNTVEQFEGLDRWFFQQDVRDYSRLLAARAAQAKPIAEAAGSALARIGISSSPGTPLALVERFKNSISLERALVTFLPAPMQALHSLEELHAKLIFDQQYSNGYRLYRYLVWWRRLFPEATAPQVNGVAAVVRVRNEILHLTLLLPVILAYFDELVIVDHSSTDGTGDYVAGLNHPKIQLFHYPKETARAGDFYAAERIAGKGSLADYYNFAFDQAKAAYVCKWDADMYPLPALRDVLREIRSATLDAAYFTGLDCYGYATCDMEPRIYRRSLNFRYEDTAYCERLHVEGRGLRVKNVAQPVYMHLKRDALLAMPGAGSLAACRSA